MRLPTVRDRIFIHLLSYTRFARGKEVPYEVSQPGIADSLGLARSHVSKEMIRLKKSSSDLVEERTRHVRGSKRRRKVYILTPLGQKKANSIIEGLMKEIITINDENGKRNVTLRELEELLNVKDPITAALRDIDEEGVLDLCKKRDIEEIFIGRERELKLFKELLIDVKKGSARTVIIKGETGIGKTRLVYELKPIALESGFLFIEGVCKVETADPYLPFKEALSGLNDMDHDEKFTKFLTYDSNSEPETRSSLDALREAVFYDSTRMIMKLSEKKPVVIFLDDLHWADKATLDLFRYMAETFENDRVLLLATYRPEEVNLDHPLVETLSRMCRKNVHMEVDLEPLDKMSTKKLIDVLTGFNTPDNFVGFMNEKTRGNPLFIKQLLKEMQDEGKVSAEKGYYATEDMNITVPEVVERIVHRKLSHLDRAGRQVLEFGCVLGKEFSFDILDSVSELPEMRLLDQIDILVDQAIWCEDAERDRFHFTHELVRDGVYNNIKSVRRKKLHGVVARKMAERYSGTKDRLSDIANHYMEAGLRENALEYYVKAGEHAKSLYAHENAVQLFEKGLTLAYEDDRKSCLLLESMGDTHTILGNYEEGRRRLEEALGKLDADNTEEIGLRTRIPRKIAHTWLMQGSYERSIEYINIGISLGAEHTKEWCILLNVKGWTYMKTGDYHKAAEIFKDELRVAEDLGDEKEISRAHHNLGTIALQSGDFDDATRHLEIAAEGFDSLGEKVKLSKTLNNLGVMYLRKHNIEKALEYNEKSLLNMEEVGDIQGIGMNLNNMGIIYSMMEDYEKALDCHDRSMDIKRRIGDSQGMVESHTNIGVIHEKMGDLERALEEYKKGLSISRKIGDARGTAELQNDIGWIYNLKGKVTDSAEMLRSSLKLREDIGDIHGLAESHRNLGIVLLKKGNMEEALEHLEKGFELASDMDDEYEMALISKCTGDVYHQQERFAEALDNYERSLELSQSVDNKGLIADTYRGMAEVFLDMEEMMSSLECALNALDISKKAKLKLEEAKTRRVHGRILRGKGKMKEAQDEFWKCRELLSETYDNEELPKVFYELAILMAECGEMDTADKYVKDARKGFEESGMHLWVERVKKFK